MDASLLSMGMQVFYNGSKKNLNGKKMTVDKVMDEETVVCSINGAGYIVKAEDLSIVKGTETWNGNRNK